MRTAKRRFAGVGQAIGQVDDRQPAVALSARIDADPRRPQPQLAGGRIGILPRRSVQREEISSELALLALPGRVSARKICLVYRKENAPNRQAAAFIDFMRGKPGA